MELEFWRTIRESEDVGDLEAYLTRYPEGTFSELAENRIAALNMRAIRLDPESSVAPAPVAPVPADPAPQVSSQPPAQQPEPIIPAPQQVPAAVPVPVPVPGAGSFEGQWVAELTTDSATLVYPACARAFQSGADFEFIVRGGRLAGDLETHGAFSVTMQMQTSVDDRGHFVSSSSTAQNRTGMGYSIEIRGDLASGTGVWNELRHRCRGNVTFSRANQSSSLEPATGPSTRAHSSPIPADIMRPSVQIMPQIRR
jgi:hypothetical protein